MQAYYFQKLGVGLDGLVHGERPEPTLGRNEVLVRVRARSLNYRDLRILWGVYPLPAETGKIALSDGAGEVAALGEGVQSVKIGDRVTATYFPRWIDGPFSMSLAAEQFGCTRDGMLASLFVANESSLVKIPPHLSFEEGATLSCAGTTAWSALNGPRPVLPGETVLTIGTGGVALFALQFAKTFNARVIAMTSSESKMEQLRKLGADEVLNYRATPKWDRAIRDMTDGRGVQHVVETGSADTLAQSIGSTQEGGVITLVSAVGAGNLNLLALSNPVLVRRIYVGSRTHLEAMTRVIAEQKLRPVIDRSFAFHETKEAYRYFEERKHMGKVIIAGD